MSAARDSVRRLRSLTLNGKQMSAGVIEAVTAASYERTIADAPTLNVTLHDPKRELLRSPLLTGPTIAKVDGFAFELAEVRKTGSSLGCRFVALEVAALDRDNTPRKAAAGSVTHVEFVRRLVGEQRWLKVVVPDGVKAPTARVELTRGEVDGDDSSSDVDGEPEGTWEAIGRIAADRGWRRFVRGPGEIVYAPDSWLLAQTPAFTVREHADGIDDVDFDWNVRKPLATMKVQARAGRWDIQPGASVDVPDLGPATGRWLVEKVAADLTRLPVAVDLIKARPTLPEPEPSDTSTSERGEDGYGSEAGGDVSTRGGSDQVRRFVDAALAHRGKPYVWGGKSPAGFDCSGLVTHAARAAGVSFPGGSKNQHAAVQRAGRGIPVQRAINTRGAVLMRMTGNPTHIAISLGDGKTIEARGRAYGVGVFAATGRGWTHGGLVPGISY